MIPRVPVILAVLFVVIACLWHAHVTVWVGSLPVATVPAMAAVGFWFAFFVAGLSLFAWRARAWAMA